MVDDLLRVMVDDDARQWVAYILGMQDKEKYLDKIEALRNLIQKFTLQSLFYGKL